MADLSERVASRIRQKFALLISKRISTIRDLLGFSEYWHQLDYFRYPAKQLPVAAGDDDGFSSGLMLSAVRHSSWPDARTQPGTAQVSREDAQCCGAALCRPKAMTTRPI
jgi:hypothetical protein